MEFVNILLQMEANPVKNASSLLQFSGHSELETGLFADALYRRLRASATQAKCSHAMYVTSRNSSRAFGKEGRNSSTLHYYI